MSLLVWLPMTKDLTQQGLSDITVSNVGATLDNNGKLGKCYYFDGNAHYLEFSKSVGDLYSGDFSYAVWLKPTDDTRSIICSEYATTGASGIAFELTASRQIRLYWNGSPDIYATGCVLPKDVWTHCVITRSGNVAKFYMNGVLTYTYEGTLANKTSTAKIRLGDDYRGGTSVTYIGYMNDFRLYNHCLSAKEVEILSRGLVAHYPLNGGGRTNNNMISGTHRSDFSTTSTSVSDGKLCVGSGGNGTFSITTDTTCPIGKYSYNVLNNTAGNRDFQQANVPYVAGKKYTGSWWAKGSETCLYRVWNGTKGTQEMGVTFTLTSEWKHYSHTFTANENMGTDNCTFHLGVTGASSINICGMKLEEGEQATPWIPNPIDSAYTTMGYDSTTEYDVSGYGYNGTKTGTFAYDVDTPRYSVDTNLKSTSTYIKISNLTTTGFANSYSFSWWGKVSSFSNLMMWGFGDGIRLNGIYNGTLWNTGDGANNPLYKPGTTTQVSAPTTNVWHHFVMTGDGTTCKVYQDGELWATAKTYKAISGTTIYINGWDTGTSYKYNDYRMSDFRIYATALSAAQVAELYNTAVSVANNGTLMGYELVEG